MTRTSSPDSISTKLQQIASLARKAPETALTTLAHHIDIEWLKEAYRRTPKNRAPGIDGQTAEEYARNLETNLQSLLDRFKSGTYRAPPVRRVEIPKEGDKMRPIGVPTFEDKVLQRAVTMVLEAVYEQEFLDLSYGFRPNRSPHQALDDLYGRIDRMGGGWLIEVDIEAFFDTLDHQLLGQFLDKRVRDGVLRRAIGKWLKAGVMNDGEVERLQEGTPQGGVVSPILSNVYLHEVFDKWFEGEVKPRMRGDAVAVRFADDIIIAFASEDDARRVMAVLPKRFEKYGLKLHPTKTRMVSFQMPRGSDGDRPASFDFLGLTQYWAKSRKGRWVVKRKTAKKRLKRAIGRIAEFCRAHRHDPIAKQHKELNAKLRGHYEYYGVTGNIRALRSFWHRTAAQWRVWLNRRSYRAGMNRTRFYSLLLLKYPLAQPRITKPYAAAAKL